MLHAEFCERDHLTREELLAIGHGRLIEDLLPLQFPRLPLPPMLMIDRITHISRNGQRGQMRGEREVRLDDWFFQCHFLGDPVQPGCLGVDAVWQLLGLYCGWRGGLGTGRALGVGEVDFGGQIRPHNKLVQYDLNIVRFSKFERSGACLAIADATVLVDGETIYTLKRARAGLFQNIAYSDYPARSALSVGGQMDD